MTPKQRTNLLRVLRPRHVAVVGGYEAEVVATECKRIGFDGPFWPVNPKRKLIGGHRCFAAVEDLPEAPDAVYLAIPCDSAIQTLAKLDSMGAGGAICYTAGFSETGVEGATAEAKLVKAAGDLALVGPNCYGLINYVDRVALWPFAHGGRCPGYGAAIITQSGMLSSDITMSQRSLPFAYMVSAGNQAMLRLEDFVDVLCDREEVRAFGLHIEGLKDISHFEAVALRALIRGKPIVALKTGTSALGAELAVSHTASLSGTDELYDALFHRLGIIKVTNPSQLLETLKLLCVTGAPKGTRVAGLTCSGAGATMLADHAERVGLTFPKPPVVTANLLRQQLPVTATVSNPLDYTTPIWGLAERTAPVFRTLFADEYDIALIVQDYPASGLEESKPHYRNDTKTFIETVKVRGLPAAVCSTLPENLDLETRDFLISNGVSPMQGIQEALSAIAAAAWFHHRRETILSQKFVPLLVQAVVPNELHVLNEAEAKKIIAAAGLPIPAGCITTGREAPRKSAELGFPLVLKMVSERLPHKTEAGAVKIGLLDPDGVAAAIKQMYADVAAFNAAAATDKFLLERMVGPPIAELMVSVRRDPQFGYAMTLATGGVLVELIRDAVTVLLPAHRGELDYALSQLRITRLIDGYRGKPRADREVILDGLERLAKYVCSGAGGIAEVEINPLFLLPEGISVVDVLMRVDSQSGKHVTA